MRGETVATWNRHRQPGGEWDAIRSLPPRARRRLIGARLLTLDGLMPDVAGEVIARAVPEVDDTCAAMRWYVRVGLASIDEARRVAHRHRHERLARAEGARSYYDLRSTRAVLDGYASLWALRQARGWGENRRRDWAKIQVDTRPESG